MKLFRSVPLIIWVFVAFLLTACDTGSNIDINHYKISDTFKQYALFDEGSYWVYQNDSSLTQDTVKIDRLVSYSGIDSDQSDYRFDVIELIFFNNQTNLIKGEISAGDYYPDPGEMNDYYRIYLNGDRFLTILSPRYEIGVEHIFGINEGLYTNLEFINHFNLNGIAYANVYHSQVIDIQADSTYHEFYLAQHFGLIKWVKMSKTDTTSISLVAASLSQTTEI